MYTHRELGIREVFLLRERARQELILFISSISLWRNRERFEHFSTGPDLDIDSSELEKAEAALLSSKKRRDDSIQIMMGRGLANDLRAGTRPNESGKLLTAFFGILRETATGGDPTEKQLTILFNALNCPVHLLVWSLKRRKLEVTSAFFSRRAVAEVLVRYLNLIAECGPVHGVCEDCGVMFIRKRERRFCHTCSAKRQTYAHRKEYLRKKRKEYYWRDAEDDREFRNKTKSTKGTMHGKTKTGKR